MRPSRSTPGAVIRVSEIDGGYLCSIRSRDIAPHAQSN